jgi:hypothetical protein
VALYFGVAVSLGPTRVLNSLISSICFATNNSTLFVRSDPTPELARAERRRQFTSKEAR